MNHRLLIIFICMFVSKINAMDLLDNKNNSNTFYQKWEFLTDQVMGGVSTGKLDIVNENDTYFIRLSGKVSTKNNGGFIQFRSNFNSKKEFEGIKIKAKGIPSDYYIHIRTSFLLLPWQYYSGKFTVTKEWSEIKIPFNDFKKSNFYQPSQFNSSDIKSIGFVAFGKDFDAQLDLIEAELF